MREEDVKISIPDQERPAGDNLRHILIRGAEKAIRYWKEGLLSLGTLVVVSGCGDMTNWVVQPADEEEGQAEVLENVLSQELTIDTLGKGLGVPRESGYPCLDPGLAQWWFDWYLETNCPDKQGYLPTLWHIPNAQQVIDENVVLTANWALYMNEPNSMSQANTTPEAAAAKVIELIDKFPELGLIHGNVFNCDFNPSDCTMGPLEWLDRYFAAGVTIRPEKDAIGVHYYKWNTQDASEETLRGYLDLFQKYGAPIVVTEYGYLDVSHATLAENQQAVAQVMPGWTWTIRTHPNVVGFSPFSKNYPNPPFNVLNIYTSPGNFTPWGQQFRDMPFNLNDTYLPLINKNSLGQTGGSNIYMPDQTVVSLSPGYYFDKDLL